MASLQFPEDADFEAFERMLEKTLKIRPMRVRAYCLLSNHWHMVLWSERDGDLGTFMSKLAITHARNWHIYRRRDGHDPLYQGRFKSFSIEGDGRFYQVVRYVERNALCANLVRNTENWRYSNLWRRLNRDAAASISDSNHGDRSRFLATSSVIRLHSHITGEPIRTPSSRPADCA